MKKLELLETNEVIPRNYGLSFTSGGASIFVVPSQYFIAATLMSTESEIDERLRKWQEFKRGHLAKPLAQHTRPEYPLFRLGKHSKVLDMKFDDLKEFLLDRISAKDGTQTLYIGGGSETVERATYGHAILTGNVRSRHDARRSNAQKYRVTRIHNPTLNLEGNLGFTDISCSCDNAFWEESKGREVRTTCYHAAALNIAFYRSANGNDNSVKFRRERPENAAIPFLLNPQQLDQTHFLDIDVLFAYYVLGETHFDINRKLMCLGYLFFSPTVSSMIMNGRANYEVIKHGRRRAKVSQSYIDAENRLVARISKILTEKEENYERRGFCIEHPGTEYEAIALRYVRKDGRMMSLVTPTTRLPPYLIMKTPIGKPQLYEILKDSDEHPFARLNRKTQGLDDMTRMPVEETIFFPGSSVGKRKTIWVPSPVYTRYREVKGSVN